MKKICVILILITAFALNTAVHGAVYSSYGDIETDNNVFKVHFEAHMMPIITDTETTETEPAESAEDSTFADTFDIISESEDTVFEMIEALTEGETSADTAEETKEDEKTVFGGEGTVKFSPEELKILSVTPLFDEDIGYELNEGEDFLRFMFYSSAEIKENFPLFDIEFEILSVDENDTVSVILTEGLFSDGQNDTPCKDVIHTVKAENFSPTTTPHRPPITEKTTTSPEQTSPSDDSDNNGKDGETSDITYDVTFSTSSSSDTNNDPNGKGSFALITVIVSVVFIVLITTAAILISEKTKRK